MDSVVIVDNRDSFTYNLAELVRRAGGGDPRVLPAGDISCRGQQEGGLKGEAADVLDAAGALILSPGPGLPGEFPYLQPLIRRYHRRKPLLGVCLGFQALCLFFGGRLRPLAEPVHGQPRRLAAAGGGEICRGNAAWGGAAVGRLFYGVPAGTEAGFYHSWGVDAGNLDPCLAVTVRSEEGLPLAVEHRHLPLFGVQFHPESFLTPQGPRMMENFLREAGRPRGGRFLSGGASGVETPGAAAGETAGEAAG